MVTILGPILAVSYDAERLNALKELFDSRQYLAVPASNLENALRDLDHGGYSALVLGATVPLEDKVKLTRKAKSTSTKISVVWSVADGGTYKCEEVADLVDSYVPSGDVNELLRSLGGLFGAA